MNLRTLAALLPLPAGSYLDAFAEVGVVVVLILGAINLYGVPRESALGRRPVILVFAALVLTAAAILNANLGSITGLWVGLIVVAAVATGLSQPAFSSDGDPGERQNDSPSVGVGGWLILAVIAGPIFWLANVMLIASTGGSSLVGVAVPSPVAAGLILVGAATAGVPPLDRWRRAKVRRPEVAFISEVCLPVVGLTLAARGIAIGFARPGVVLLALLLVVGLTGLGPTLLDLWRGRGWRSDGGAERALSFLVLALPVGFAGLLALVVLLAGAVARRFLLWPGQTASESVAAPAVVVDDSPSLARRRGGRVRRPGGLWQAFAALLVEPERAIEERFDLAVGIVLAVAVLFVFAG